MNPVVDAPKSNDDIDNQFVDLLTSLDESIASGIRSTATDTENPTDSPSSLRLARAKQCLDRLESLWPRSEHSLPPLSESSFQDLIANQSIAVGGRRFGRFIIRRELGRGAHGIVFLAFDPSLRRDVALKVPRPDALLTPDLRKRFLREAQAAAVLDHVNIIRIHEIGEAGPACYLAAEYCRGPNLSDWLRQRSTPLASRTAAELAYRLADALNHAHQRNVLHRDLKPSNVLLDPRRAGPVKAAASLPFEPKLTDFGLAKVVEEGCGEETRSGAILGTPRYMAPEQAEGRLKAVDATTDVYSLGATLYEMLVGQPPHVGANDAETLHLVRSAEPLPPRRLRPEIPRDLEAICLKCLEKDRHRRYGSASALAEDLKRFLDGKPTLARPLRMADRVWRWARREPMGAAFAVTCVLAAVLLTASWIWYTLKIQAAANLAADVGWELIERERQLRQTLAATTLRLVHDDRQHGMLDRARSHWTEWKKQPRNLRDVRWLTQLTNAILGREPDQLLFVPRFRIDPSRQVLHARWSSDGLCLITLDHQNTIQRWDPQEGRIAWSVPLGRKGAVPQLQWSSTFDRIAVWSADAGCLGIVDRQGYLVPNGEDVSGPLLGMTTTPVANALTCVAVFSNGVVAGYQADGLRWQANGPSDAVAVRMLNTLNLTAVLGRSSGLMLVSSDGGQEIRKLAAPVTTPQSLLAVSADENMAASIGELDRPILWNLHSGEVKWAETGPEMHPTAIVVSPTNDAVIVGDQTGRIHFWHITTGRYLFQLKELHGAVEQIVFPPGSDWFHVLVRDGQEFQGFQFRIDAATQESTDPAARN